MTTAAVLGVVALAAGFAGGWFVRKATTSTTTTSTLPTATTSTLPATTTSSSTTTTLAALAKCTGASLSGKVVSQNGAAGTLESTFQVTNSAAVACTLRGYPLLQLVSANGSALPTATLTGQTTFSVPAANAAPALQTVTAGGHATFLIQYSDVPVGTQSSCPQAASVNVYPPASAVPFNVVASLGPCGLGTVHVSPFYGAT